MDMEEMEGMDGQGPAEKDGAIVMVVKKRLQGEPMEEGGGATCPKCGCKLKIEAED